MNPFIWSSLSCIALGVAMLVVSSRAHVLARRRWERQAEAGEGGPALIHGAIFAMLGLLLAFTFSQAYGRFQERRGLIVEEANAIGTLRLRLDLLPAPAREHARHSLLSYVEGRLATWAAISDSAQVEAEIERTGNLGEALWSEVVSATSDAAFQPSRILILPALNEMLDLGSVRLAIARAHPPIFIFGLLFFVALLCSGLAGAASGHLERMPRLLPVAFAVLCSGTIFLILDIEYPRFGWVNLDSANELLAEQLRTLR